MQVRWKYTFAFLTLVIVLVWLAVFTYPDKNLKVIACDVGQGDAILVVHGSFQILVDGGPNSKVVDCIADHLPFYDRKIEAVIISHPQTDHFGGVIDVIRRFEVGTIIATGLDSGSSDWQVLKNEVRGRGIRVINPTAGMELSSGLIHLDILHPSRESFLASENSMLAPASGDPSGQAVQNNSGVLGSFTSTRDPNEFSIVAILSFKEFDALLTGDISPAISDKVADGLEENYKKSIEYIKIPHHGSKNGLSTKLLDVTGSKIAVISAGKNNSYGHPHEEVLRILGDKDIKILRTDEVGDVVVESDGSGFWIIE